MSHFFELPKDIENLQIVHKRILETGHDYSKIARGCLSRASISLKRVIEALEDFQNVLFEEAKKRKELK